MKINLNRKQRMAIWTVIGGLALVGAGVVADNYKTYTTDYIPSKTVIETKNKGYKGEVAGKLEDMSTTEIIHEMANTIIEAKDGEVWGEIEPSPANLDYVIAELEKETFQNPKLVNSIKQWRKGKFVNVVWVHNHVWDILSGSIGEAREPKDSKIIELLQKYDYSK